MELQAAAYHPLQFHLCQDTASATWFTRQIRGTVLRSAPSWLPVAAPSQWATSQRTDSVTVPSSFMSACPLPTTGGSHSQGKTGYFYQHPF